MFIISLVMDIELSLLKFINHYTKHNRDDNGEKYSEDQTNLVETFVYSVVEKIHPKIFEKNIIENKMKLKSKRRKTCIVKIPLNPIQIRHHNKQVFPKNNLIYLEFENQICKYFLKFQLHFHNSQFFENTKS